MSTSTPGESREDIRRARPSHTPVSISEWVDLINRCEAHNGSAFVWELNAYRWVTADDSASVGEMFTRMLSTVDS